MEEIKRKGNEKGDEREGRYISVKEVISYIALLKNWCNSQL